MVERLIPFFSQPRYESGELSEEVYLGAMRQDAELETGMAEGEQAPGDLDTFGADAELTTPEDRIIETEEETEGLF